MVADVQFTAIAMILGGCGLLSEAVYAANQHVVSIVCPLHQPMKARVSLRSGFLFGEHRLAITA